MTIVPGTTRLGVLTAAVMLTAGLAIAQPGPDNQSTTATASAAAVQQQLPTLLDLNEIVIKSEAEEAGVGGLRQTVVLNRPDVTVVLLNLEEGGIKADHTAPGTATIHVLEGAVELKIGDKTHDLKTGVILVLDPEVNHSVTAREKSKVLVTINKQINKSTPQ